MRGEYAVAASVWRGPKRGSSLTSASGLIPEKRRWSVMSMMLPSLMSLSAPPAELVSRSTFTPHACARRTMKLNSVALQPSYACTRPAKHITERSTPPFVASWPT